MNKVFKPKHYTQGPIECIDAIVSMLGPTAALDYFRAQAFKYIWRCRDKDDTTGDLEKAGYYINCAIELLKKETA